MTNAHFVSRRAGKGTACTQLSCSPSPRFKVRLNLSCTHNIPSPAVVELQPQDWSTRCCMLLFSKDKEELETGLETGPQNSSWTLFAAGAQVPITHHTELPAPAVAGAVSPSTLAASSTRLGLTTHVSPSAPPTVPALEPHKHCS